MDKTNEERMETARHVQRHVSWDTGLSQGWVARQQTGGVTFILDREWMHFTDEQLDTISKDELIEMTFKKVLGFRRYSKEHAQYRVNQWQEDVKTIQSQIDRLVNQKTALEDLIDAYSNGYPTTESEATDGG